VVPSPRGFDEVFFPPLHVLASFFPPGVALGFLIFVRVLGRVDVVLPGERFFFSRWTFLRTYRDSPPSVFQEGFPVVESMNEVGAIFVFPLPSCLFIPPLLIFPLEPGRIFPDPR